jgi:hypothetical protein
MDIPEDMTPDMLGIGLGLGEEIAIEEGAERASRADEGVLSLPVRYTNLLPVRSAVNPKILDLTDMNNWLVPTTKRLRSPFIEKWKRVALGYKEPDAPLLTYTEEEAYHMARDNSINNVEDDKEVDLVISKLNKLGKKLSISRLRKMGKRIEELRYSNDKNQDNGKEGF